MTAISVCIKERMKEIKLYNYRDRYNCKNELDTRMDHYVLRELILIFLKCKSIHVILKGKILFYNHFFIVSIQKKDM